MGTITHTFDPNQDVFVIASCGETKSFITSGSIVRVRGVSLVSETTVEYDVRLKGDKGTTEVLESNIFVDKPTALAEYDNRVS